MKAVVAGLFFVVALPGLTRAATLQPTEAVTHIDETATVCGVVASARQVLDLRGEPVFLCLGHGYPEQDFTIVVPAGDRADLPKAETLLGHQVCASGLIQRFRGKPQLVLESPAQLKDGGPACAGAGCRPN
jgi:hypothetical protein